MNELGHGAHIGKSLSPVAVRDSKNRVTRRAGSVVSGGFSRLPGKCMETRCVVVIVAGNVGGSSGTRSRGN